MIADAVTHPLTKDLTITRESGIGSYLGVPILLQDGTMFGTVCALSPEPYDYSDEDVQIAMSLTKFLSAALELEELAAGFQLKSTALESTANAVSIADRHGKILWVNSAYTELTGFPLEEMQGEHYRQLLSKFCDATIEHQILDTVMRGESWKGEVTNARKDGSTYHVELTVTPVHNEQGEVAHFIAMKQDITERKRSEERLHYLAHYDTLTSLPNRNKFRDELTTALAVAAEEDSRVALLYLDLDRFKSINDTLGHDIGDHLLRAAARRVQACVRDQDIVSRISGDEFTVILPSVTSQQQVEEVATRIAHAVAEPLPIDNYELFISTSIGIACFPCDGTDPETLIKNADLAMFNAKEQGRNKFSFYTAEMDASPRLEMENYLRRALEKNEMSLYYQPKVDISTGQMIGMEALLRWKHPVLGFVSPDVFIPISEEIGMIGPIGEFALRTACRQNKAWQDAGYPKLSVAVNLSVSQFQYNNIVEKVKGVLAETHLEPHYLELEITESVIIQNTDKVIETLLELKELGIQISIDDFGTGYSSLRYLQMLPIDMLKIDRSFIKDINDCEGNGAAIPKAIITLAHSLGLRVIAEGVETESQLCFLRGEQCDAIQGYLFSRPLPVEKFERLLRERSALPVRK